MKANQNLVCPIANCQKGDGSAHVANSKCKWNPPCCAQCCKMAGGCGLPSHQLKAALPLPLPLPVVLGPLPVPEAIDPALMTISAEIPASSLTLTSGPLPVPAIDPVLIMISAEPASSLTLTSTATSSLPIGSTPSHTLPLSTTHTGPTTRLYAHPLSRPVLHRSDLYEGSGGQGLA